MRKNDKDSLFSEKFEQYIQLYEKEDLIDQDNCTVRVKTSHLIKTLMKDMNIPVVMDIQDLFLKHENIDYRIIERDVGLPSQGEGFPFDPNHRVYTLKLLKHQCKKR